MAPPTWCGARSDRLVTLSLSQRDAWGWPSILVSSPLLAFIVIYNSDHPLGAGVEVHMLNLDGLAASSASSIKDLKQVILKFDELFGIAAVDRDVFLAQVTLAKLQHAER